MQGGPPEFPEAAAPVNMIVPAPVERKKRGRPPGTGTGTHMLRAYHKAVEQQEREEADALALAVLPQPGTAAYARAARTKQLAR